MSRPLFAAGLCCLALTACGSSTSGSGSGSSATFKTSYATVSNATQPVGPELEQALVGADKVTNAELSTEMTQLAGKVASIRAEFAALHPPASAQSLMSNYLADLGRIAGDLTALAKSAATGNASSAPGITRTLVADLKAAYGQKAQMDRIVGYTAPASSSTSTTG